MKRIALGPTVALLFLGCAVGRRHTYDEGHLNLRYRGSTQVALAVHDQRREVVNRIKPPTFVGVSRGGFGNPFDVTTQSGRPLAVDFADTIGHALAANNFRVAGVAVFPDQSARAAISALMRTGAPRLMLVGIDQWKSDTYNNTALEYDVTAQVFDERANLIARANIEGRDALGGNFGDPGGYAEAVIPGIYIKRLERLLNRLEIGRALEVSPITPEPADPSTDAPPARAAP